MQSKHVTSIILACALSAHLAAQEWQIQPVLIQTRWAAQVSPTNALPEYPRPQMVRERWENLNGLWRYAITGKGADAPSRYDGKILVPYPLEAALSGVKKALQPDQLLWYERTITPPPRKTGDRTLLHFGAIDWQATVYVNGREIGTHTGGYQSFSFDITDALRGDSNELVVRVYDPTDKGPNPHGKQRLSPGGIFYTSTSGIWQTVWLETVPQAYIDGLDMTPDVDRGELHLSVDLKGQADGYSVQAIATSNGQVVAQQDVRGAGNLRIANPRLWSPDDPYLYDLEVRLLKDGRVVDRVKSYFGLRQIKVKKDSRGTDRIFLNGTVTYNLGLLDQGFWPDGIYTAPTDEALKFDIEAAKAMGFNTIRKHIKVEPDRWYYWCDKLGMLVWQDMVNPADDSPESRAEFERENTENLAQLHNHPSITTWVLFNEGWGAYDQARLAASIRAIDPSRLVDAHTGENLSHNSPQEVDLKWVGSDLTDMHHYPDPDMPPYLSHRARVLGEFGGSGVFIDGHVWNDLTAGGWGYVKLVPADLAKTYAGMIGKLNDFKTLGLSGSIYTQPFDVEGEQNGLMTYDRAVIKIPVAEIRRINTGLLPTTLNYAESTRDFSAADADLTPEPERYTKSLTEYRSGKRDLPFLRGLTLMALRQKDQVNATEAGNDYINGSPQPYSQDIWNFIQKVTRTSKDKGFALMQAQTEVMNGALGANAAEQKIREVINREEVAPYVTGKDAKPDWKAIEQKVSAGYGALGREEVYGKEMIYCYEQKDWSGFGKFYAQYFKTAATRSEYNINNYSWELFEHVTDPEILQAAIKADKYSLDTFEKDSAEAMDTYANLLYKAGETAEAIEWEEKAAQKEQVIASKENRAAEKVYHDTLEKMKKGIPTWDS